MLSLAATFLNTISSVVAITLTVMVSMMVWSQRYALSAVLSNEMKTNEDIMFQNDSIVSEVQEDSHRAILKERNASSGRLPTVIKKEEAKKAGINRRNRKNGMEQNGGGQNGMDQPTTYIDLQDADLDYNRNRKDISQKENRIQSGSEDDPSNTLVEPLLSNTEIGNNNNNNNNNNENVEKQEDTTQWDQEDHLVKLASSYVRDALKGRYNRFAPWAVDVVVAGSRKKDTQYRLYLHRWLHNMRFFRTLNLIIFLSLSFFEQPIWCYKYDTMERNSCTNDDMNPHILFFGLPVLPQSVTLTVEFVCIFFFALEMVAKAKILGTAQFFRNRWYMIQIVLLTADLTGVGVMVLAPSSLPLWNPIIRPIVFVALSQSMRGALTTLLRTLPSVSKILYISIFSVSSSLPSNLFHCHRRISLLF